MLHLGRCDLQNIISKTANSFGWCCRLNWNWIFTFFAKPDRYCWASLPANKEGIMIMMTKQWTVSNYLPTRLGRLKLTNPPAPPPGPGLGLGHLHSFFLNRGNYIDQAGGPGGPPHLPSYPAKQFFMRKSRKVKSVKTNNKTISPVLAWSGLGRPREENWPDPH